MSGSLESWVYAIPKDPNMYKYCLYIKIKRTKIWDTDTFICYKKTTQFSIYFKTYLFPTGTKDAGSFTKKHLKWMLHMGVGGQARPWVYIDLQRKKKLYFKTPHNLLLPSAIWVLNFCMCNQLNRDFKHPKRKAWFARLALAENTAFCRTNPLSSHNGNQRLKDFPDKLLI